MKHKGLSKFYKLVESLEQMPSIGKKSAQKLAYIMVSSEKFNALKLAHAIEDAVRSVQKCNKCGSLCEDELCDICVDEHRDNGRLCIVENAKDIFIIEETGSYDGRYFVLGSLEECDFDLLIELIKGDKIKEIIFALTPSLANNTIIFYMEEKLGGLGLTFTKIAQGVPTGVNLENVDFASVGMAFENRVKV